MKMKGNGTKITALYCQRFYLPKFPSAALSSIAVALATAQSSALHRKICSAQSGAIFNCRSNIMVREAKEEDLKKILELYLYLHEESVPEQSEYLLHTWKEILEDKRHHLIVNEYRRENCIFLCMCYYS